MANNNKNKQTEIAKRVSRLISVQLLYQMEISNDFEERLDISKLSQIINDEIEVEHIDIKDHDINFISLLTNGILGSQTKIDNIINNNLNENWKYDKIDSVIRAILRCAVFELTSMHEIPKAVVINEYLEIGHSFYDKDQVSFLNAILDNISKNTDN